MYLSWEKMVFLHCSGLQLLLFQANLHSPRNCCHCKNLHLSLWDLSQISRRVLSDVLVRTLKLLFSTETGQYWPLPVRFVGGKPFSLRIDTYNTTYLHTSSRRMNEPVSNHHWLAHPRAFYVRNFDNLSDDCFCTAAESSQSTCAAYTNSIYTRLSWFCC